MNSIPICSEGCAHFISTLKNKHDSYSQTKIYVQTIVWIYIIDFFFLVCSTINHRIIQKIIYFKYPASQPLSILHLLIHPPPLTCASTCLTIHSTTQSHAHRVSTHPSICSSIPLYQFGQWYLCDIVSWQTWRKSKINLQV